MLTVGTNCPDATIVDSTGEEVQLQGFRGFTILLAFLAPGSDARSVADVLRPHEARLKARGVVTIVVMDGLTHSTPALKAVNDVDAKELFGVQPGDEPQFFLIDADGAISVVAPRIVDVLERLGVSDMKTTDEVSALKPETTALVERIREHPLFTHPLFQHWAQSPPRAAVAAALFHQIQMFCASTRPGHEFPEALRRLRFEEQAELMHEIVLSESGHGQELATMAAYIVNKSPAGNDGPVFPSMFAQDEVESRLKTYSDRIFGNVQGYDIDAGLTPEAHAAIQVFERRKLGDRDSAIRNLGAALALEITSNQHLIPGEKEALVDSNAYELSLEDAPMHYLKEHWGECGAEQQHEKNVIEAVNAIVDETTEPLIVVGAMDFLNSLLALWNRLDTVFIASDESKDAALVAS